MTPEHEPYSDDDTWTDDAEPLTEDDAFEIALNDHPELRAAYQDQSLPEELMDEEGRMWNPRTHLDLHAVIERQIATNDPPGIADIAAQLEDLEIDHHEIRHIIARPLTNQIWYMLQEHRPFDESQYLDELKTIVNAASEGERGADAS